MTRQATPSTFIGVADAGTLVEQGKTVPGKLSDSYHSPNRQEVQRDPVVLTKGNYPIRGSALPYTASGVLPGIPPQQATTMNPQDWFIRRDETNRKILRERKHPNYHTTYF